MYTDPYTEQYADREGWSHFMTPPEPLPEGRNPADLVTIEVPRRKVNHDEHAGNRIWNDIARSINTYPFLTSDQCSPKHYRDVFEFLRLNNGVVRRVAECGVFHGGMSVLLAGCALAFDLRIDLIDVNPECLLASYHRIRATFPEALDRVRLFWGELPNFVQAVAEDPDFDDAVIHHDGSHTFNVVVRDLSSLYFLRNKLHAVLIQDTHLRNSDVNNFCFVDAAVAAVFGHDLRYQPIGAVYANTSHPNGYRRGEQDNVYFVKDRSEGMMIPLAENEFLYPHPNIHVIEDFILFPTRQAENQILHASPETAA